MTAFAKIKTGSGALRLAAAALALTAATATVYEVSPDGASMNLTEALDVAVAGDTISLGDGIYREPIVTMHGGEEGNPLVIEGGRNAVINYFSGNRSLMWDQKVVDIRHSWITLRGFTVDGWLDDNDVEESYVDKCIWVEGQEAPTTLTYGGEEVESSLIGTVIDDMKIQNCGMECIRMRNWVTNSIIKNNDIEDCGIYDFRFQFDGVIGEAIYIGTSSNQWTDGPDGSNYNLVTSNKLVPRGNECVDIKEGATMNVVEYNDCSEQLDSESGCYDSRGNGNIFRYNYADECLGAGIRLGGHVIDDFVYGVDNDVYGNVFTGTAAGSIKARQDPQGIICGNSCDDGDCDVSEEGDDEEIDETWDQACPSSFPVIPFVDDMAEGDAEPEVPAPTPSTTGAPTAAEGDTEPEVPAPTPSTTDAPTAATDKPVSMSSPEEDDDGALPMYEALGCFADTGAGRVMSYKINDPNLTTESCAQECIGFSFFGTQFATECWCGGNDTDHVQHGESESCNMDCGGDPSQICGGEWSMNVYEYTTSPVEVTPTPEPTTSADPFSNDDVVVEEDSTCNGVLSNLGYYCCSASCGTCGGSGCSSREGGALECCTSNIFESGVMCAENGGAAPCIVDTY